ncbi:DUF2790 domain-containing protein [Pseudomonas nitroreducens]|uniref:DUF2790 domain-containing protein n=1 Tax=Pseudomonas nitroreducens TaxID=46680 RepID=UPI002D7EB7F0|nr:DUF2790 domain-containing protein [Pseudomonas nitroreducens]
MKLASVVSAVISSLAPMAFAQDAIKNPGADLPVTEYQYGMSLDVDKVLHRTDNSGKVGIVPAYMVYQDHEGQTHKVRFLEWGGSTSQG